MKWVYHDGNVIIQIFRSQTEQATDSDGVEIAISCETL